MTYARGDYVLIIRGEERVPARVVEAGVVGCMLRLGDGRETFRILGEIEPAPAPSDQAARIIDAAVAEFEKDKRGLRGRRRG